MSAAPVSRRVAALALAAAALAVVVIVFGAFVRLSNAGLSCPDWPTCYGKATWPVHGHEIDAANAAYPERPVELAKAWREQVHRHLAAVLGVLVLGLALIATWRHRGARTTVLAAVTLVGIAIPVYMQGAYVASAVLAAVGEALLLAVAWRQRDARLAVVTLAVIVFQAMLGMWTVTWMLKPVVVMAHLMGGLTTFALLLWAALRASGVAYRGEPAPARAAVIAGLVLLGLQIALGGWTSANYAALACGTDFPTCLGRWWPETDFAEGFVLWRGIGVDYEGGVLDGPARTAIQLAHRLFAVLVTLHIAALAWRCLRTAGFAAHGAVLGGALVLQLGLGVANVVAGLPLAVATLHNAGAVLLLTVLMVLLARVTPARHPA